MKSLKIDHSIREMTGKASQEPPSDERAAKLCAALSRYLHRENDEGGIIHFSVSMPRGPRHNRIMVAVSTHDGNRLVYRIFVDKKRILIHDDEDNVV